MATKLPEISKRVIAVSRRNKGIKYSDDNGETWNQSNIKSGSFKKPIQFSNGIVIARCTSIGDQGILYTEDGGAKWKPTSLGKGYYQEITEMDDGTLIVTSLLDGGGAWKSKDGKKWTKINTLEEDFVFLNQKELLVSNSSAYIAELINLFGSVQVLIGNNNNNVHKIQKELMLLQKRTGIDITSSVTGGANPEEFINTKIDDITPILEEIQVILNKLKK